MAYHAFCSGLTRPPSSKYQHKPIPTPNCHRSPPPPDPRRLLPRSASVQNSTPRLLSSLFPTSKVGHCLLCIIQQLEWLCVRALDCDLGDMQPAGGVQSKKKKRQRRRTGQATTHPGRSIPDSVWRWKTKWNFPISSAVSCFGLLSLALQHYCVKNKTDPQWAFMRRPVNIQSPKLWGNVFLTWKKIKRGACRNTESSKFSPQAPRTAGSALIEKSGRSFWFCVQVHSAYLCPLGVKYFQLFVHKKKKKKKRVCVRSTGVLAQAGILPGMQSCCITAGLWMICDWCTLRHVVFGAAPSENRLQQWHTHTHTHTHTTIHLLVQVLSCM